MNKEFYKEYLKPFIVLSVICLLVSALLGFTNMVTAPIIEENNNAAAIATRKELLPEATTFKHIPTEYPGVISFHMDEGGSGSVIVAAFKGYGGLIPVTVAIGPDGHILDLRVDTSTETTGVGTKASTPEYLQNFIGKGYADLEEFIAALPTSPEADTAGEATSEATADSSSEATGDTTSEATGDTTSEATGDTTSEATGDTTSEATGDTTSEATGDTTSEATGDTTSEATADSSSEATGDTTSEATGDTTSEATGETVVPSDGTIDTISGATYSSKAVINGVAAAMGAYNEYMKGAH